MASIVSDPIQNVQNMLKQKQDTIAAIEEDLQVTIPIRNLTSDEKHHESYARLYRKMEEILYKLLEVDTKLNVRLGQIEANTFIRVDRIKFLTWVVASFAMLFTIILMLSYLQLRKS